MLRRLYVRSSTRLRYAWSSGALTRWLRYGGLAVAVIWVTWIVVTGLLVRRDAADIRDRLARVQAQIAQGDLAGARSTAETIPALAHRAHELTTGPAWWTASVLPYVGRPFEIARTATSVADDVGSDGVPALLQVATDLDPTVLRTGPSSVNLAPIAAAAPKLTTAARVLDDAVTRLDAAPHSSWLSQVDTVRTELAQDLRAVADYVDAGARTTRVLPEMLGNDGPRRYFVGLQNEAELRGTGGLPGAFAIAVANHGTVRFTHFESDDALLPAANNYLVPTGLDFGTDYNQIYGASGPTQLFQNSNLSPSFSYAARIWAAMWEKSTGEHVDGAVALDPQVLANFLSATGPVPTSFGVTLSAESVVSLTQQQQYTLFPDDAQRKKFLVDVLHTVADRILDGSAAPRLLVQAMSRSAQQHRVLVWTDDATVQRQIDETNYAGMQEAGDRPLIGLVLNNLVGGKLDYYLGRSLSYTRIGCGASRDMVVTISLTNSAPASGLPAIVTGRLDGATRTSGGEGPFPGDNRTLLDYFATSGAQLTSVTIDGTPSTAAVLDDRGHPVYRFDLELPRGTTREIVLHLSEPAGQGAPVVWRQPGVVPLRVEGVDQPCS